MDGLVEVGGSSVCIGFRKERVGCGISEVLQAPFNVLCGVDAYWP